MRVVLRLRIFPLFLLAFSFSLSVRAQETIVEGKVTDANSGDPIPFVNVVFKGTSIGATTDFNGHYQIRTLNASDSLLASYIGYKVRVKGVQKGIKQTINFQLEEDVISLQEVVITAGENPAWAIMRNVVDNKAMNDKRKLVAYEYDTYTKIEIDVDNISEKLREKKIMKKITQVLDSVERIAGEDGKPILPLFISESISKYYYRDNPRLVTENLKMSKINGLGVTDGNLVTQVIGSSFQEYNFYQNWLNIVSKDFVSPAADGWRLYYEYDLTDSLYIDDDFCYRLDFFPRSPQDLAFSGTMWITKNEFAIKQIDASVGRKANLNFIEKIRIQQQLQKTEDGAWLPKNNRVLIDISELTDYSAGMLAKFFTSNKNFVINKPKELEFYSRPITMAEDARMYEDDKYWDTLRYEPLSETEKNVYKMIDTLQNIPVVKTYVDIVKVIVNGYYKVGKVYLGPYIGVMAVNNIEGFRLQAGFKTNINFSDRWVVGAQLAYGFNDERYKYNAYLQNIISRKRWTTLTVSTRSDLGRVGIDDENLSDNFLFLAAQRFGAFRRGNYFDESKISFKRELFKGYSQRIAFRYATFDPTFNFGYYERPNDLSAPVLNSFQNAEVIVESRFAKDEVFLINDNDRISLGTLKWPIVELRYTRGVKGVIGSDFEYDKLRLDIYKRIKFGPLGVAYVNLTGEHVFNTLPYPLLAYHLGNQSPFYTNVTYNLMDYGEFVSDSYVSIRYRHHFEGFLLNRIPLIRKLKWRLVGTVSAIQGGLRDENRALIATTTSDGQQTLGVGSLGNVPYLEVGYGVENILKIFRVDFIHRMSYLQQPDVRRFGVFFSVNLTL
ncbi:MAG: DUF5686 family protein [Cyclobacteriaceae bacterium]